MKILGISCGHDANICIVHNGEIVLHFEKERFTRRKHDAGAVDDLIQLALNYLGWSINDLDLIASSMPVWPEYGSTGKILSGEIYQSIFEHSIHQFQIFGRQIPAVFIPHHVGHMSYAYYLSGYKEADIIAVDAYGNFTATAFGVGEGEKVVAIRDLSPSNLGSLWSMVSRRIFGNMLDAGKTMGLAPYGNSIYLDDLKHRYLEWKEGFPIINEPWRDSENIPFLNKLGDQIDPMHPIAKDMAASVQKLTNEVMLDYVCGIKRISGKPNLCLSGGIALNGIANNLIAKSQIYDNVFIGPAPNDGGLSIGFALYAFHNVLGSSLSSHADHVFLSMPYTNKIIKDSIRKFSPKIRARYVKTVDQISEVATHLKDGRIIAWYLGRAESGPRALGHRSILCNPAIEAMKDTLNHRVKHRESFRPFAPSVLSEAKNNYFDLVQESPYMLRVVSVHSKSRNEIPAVVHIDGSSRPQTVGSDRNLIIYKELINEFGRQCGIPLILNTSFNIRGEPIVETPQDAILSFLASDIDYLVLENWIIDKK